jgi:Tfp pilus assembly ATPase PilU
MHTFDQDLIRLFAEGRVTNQAVLGEATNPEDVSLRLKSAGGGE